MKAYEPQLVYDRAVGAYRAFDPRPRPRPGPVTPGVRTVRDVAGPRVVSLLLEAFGQRPASRRTASVPAHLREYVTGEPRE